MAELRRFEWGWGPISVASRARYEFGWQRQMGKLNEIELATEVYSAVELKNLTVRIQGLMAEVTGEYSQVGTNDGKDNTSSGIYTNTWVKRKGRWLVIQSVFP